MKLKRGVQYLELSDYPDWAVVEASLLRQVGESHCPVCRAGDKWCVVTGALLTSMGYSVRLTWVEALP